ncbi:MAG: hypothetical protein ACI9LS_000900, partial [Flavobacteriales bacterium]
FLLNYERFLKGGCFIMSFIIFAPEMEILQERGNKSLFLLIIIR